MGNLHGAVVEPPQAHQDCAAKQADVKDVEARLGGGRRHGADGDPDGDGKAKETQNSKNESALLTEFASDRGNLPTVWASC